MDQIYSPHRPFRLGTRASPLALAQADMTKAALCAAHGWDSAMVALVPMTASGDKDLSRPLADMGGKALWTRELDRALMADDIDAAVHSMKDVETLRPDAIAIAAMLPRADVRDRLIGADSLAALRPGAVVGTSAPRRAAMLRRARPDLDIVLLRGNVATRLAKVGSGAVDATLLAAAGLARLGLDIGTPLAVDDWLPAASQGAIGIECRADDDAARRALAAIGDVPTMQAVMAERALLAALGADCHAPVGAYARLDGGMLMLSAELIAPDGQEVVADHMTGAADDGAAMGAQLAQRMLARASADLRALFHS